MGQVHRRPLAPARAVALALAGLVANAPAARAECPSRAACPTPCEMCRVPPAAGSNLTVGEMSSLFDRIAEGPARYGDLGWNFGARNTISRGNSACGGSIPRELVPAFFPCLLLKSIYTTESSWRQFCDSGRTVVSFDCGYGIAQVTSGMRPGDTSAFDPNRVASSAAYNVSVGAAILRDKWLGAPCVGANDPQIIEHWYFATWGYNGFAFKNNPNNPMYRADRVEFRTPGVSYAQTRGNYPYQELVWGYAHYPPSAAHWTGLQLVYPPRSAICATCASPMSSIAELPGAHRSTCPALTSPGDAGVDAGFDASLVDGSRADALVDAPRADGGLDALVPAPDALPATPDALAADAPARDTSAASLDATPRRDGATGADGAAPGDAAPADDAPATPSGCACDARSSRRRAPLEGLALATLVLAAVALRRRTHARARGVAQRTPG